MKLVVPYIGEIRTVDARMVRLAEFLGIECQFLPLAKPVPQTASCLGSEITDRATCLVLNPDVMKEWMDGEPPSPEFVLSLLSVFHHVLVYAVRPDPFDSRLIAALSGGCFQAVREVQDYCAPYNIASDSRDICDSFAGLSFGLANRGNDRTFVSSDTDCAKKLIAIGHDAFLTEMKRENTKIFLLGSESVADIDAEVGEAWFTEYFSQFVPHAMVLRHIFGEQCWRPARNYASVVVDDPLLRANYGFLNFERLLSLMKQHNFHTTIAFIPHNFRRTSPRIAAALREHAARLSLCFHGNDHTAAEFASTDSVLLNTMLQTAEERMRVHSETTGLRCDRVMVFPQGQFSVKAMAALNARNFDAVVNSVPYPRHQSVRLTLRELALPAVLRYSGFPLFLRKNSLKTQDTEIAFKLFFGIPILIVEHHDIFENPQNLIDAVTRINAVAPGIRWSSAGEAVSGSILRRRVSNGPLELKAYARTILVENNSASPKRILIEWDYPDPPCSLGAVHRNGFPCDGFEVVDSRIRFSAVLDPGISETFSIRHRPSDTLMARLGFRYRTGAFVRRRLSEIRDNYVSKSPALLAATKTLQRRLHR
ncbi:MAG: hypothetical protein ABSA39_14195 [Edaphobacter sp.]